MSLDEQYLMGSICAPFDIKLPDGVKAEYIYGMNWPNSTEKAYELKDNILPAYCPALLSADKPVTQTYKGYLTIKNDYVQFNRWSCGSLREFNYKEAFPDRQFYVFGVGNTGATFYLLKGDIMPANRFFFVR